jgi:hypothetical protein
MFPDRAVRDAAHVAALQDAGFSVIRFEQEDQWDKVAAQYEWLFGPIKVTP